MEFYFIFFSRRTFGTFKGLTPVALYLIPRRRFGQGRKIPIFGHAETKSTSKYPNMWPFLFAPAIGMLIFYMIDWRFIKERFGWNPIKPGSVSEELLKHGGMGQVHVSLHF